MKILTMAQQTQTNKVEYPQVSELCDFRKGRKVSSTKIKTKDSVPYLLIDTLRGAEPEFFTEDKNYTEAIPEDILIVADGANSGLVGTGVKGAVGSTILRIRLKVKDLDKDYLSYFLKSKFEEFNKDMKGTGIPHLKPQKMLESTIRKPSFPEQTLIVQEIEKQFTRLDEAVKSLKSVKKKLEIYRKAVLKRAFEKFFDGDTAIKEYCDEIKQIVPQKEDFKEFYYVDIASINNQRKIIESPKIIFSNKAPSRARQETFPGDVLYSTVRTYLRNISIVPNLNGKIISSTGFVVLRPKKSLNNKWLFYLVNTERLNNDISSKQVGTSYPAIRKSELLNYKITVPSIQEQTATVQSIESKFSVIDKIEQVVNESLEKSEKLRKSILKSAFEGKLVKMEEVGE